MAGPDYRPLPGSERRPIPGATSAAPADPDEEIRVTVLVRRAPGSNLGEIADTAAAKASATSPHLSRDELASRHGPDPGDLARVAEFARRHGLTVVDTNDLHRSVVLSGRVAAFSAAFQVELSRVQHETGSFRGRTGAIHVPADLISVIEAVIGLDDRPQAEPRLVLPAPDAGGTSALVAALSPVRVAQLYNFPTGVTGQGQGIGIIELGGGFDPGDLQAFFRGLGLPLPQVTAVSVDGGQNAPSSPPANADIEVALDIEVAGAVAPAARIAVYFAPNTDQGFLNAILTAIHDSTNNPSVISISWGSPESNWTQQSLNAFEQRFQDAAALGVTVCCASGDNGSSDGVGDGLAHVDFPASAPHALGCGGTTLDTSSTAINSEVVWSGGGATGGGISDQFSLPSYQTGAGVPASVNPGHVVGRGVPDVSGDADPRSGYEILVGGQPRVVGGTSAVAPLWAGLVALCNQALNRRLGFVNPGLYTAKVSSTFRDITSGSNGAYSARSGWDPCTGLGSPDGQRLLQALQSPGGVAG